MILRTIGGLVILTALILAWRFGLECERERCRRLLDWTRP